MTSDMQNLIEAMQNGEVERGIVLKERTLEDDNNRIKISFLSLMKILADFNDKIKINQLGKSPEVLMLSVNIGNLQGELIYDTRRNLAYYVSKEWFAILKEIKSQKIKMATEKKLKGLLI
jgi:hypothetical protein